MLSTLDLLRRDLLAARDQRAAAVARLAGTLPGGYSLVFLSLNVPGEQKRSTRLDRLFSSAVAAVLADAPGAHVAAEGCDALGKWAALAWNAAPTAVKERCVGLEEAIAGGRLVDLDVFDRNGGQIDRRSLGLPPRTCLLCGEPAVECIRTQRHAAADVQAAARRLLIGL